MATIKIRGQHLNIDVREELEVFNWDKPDWRGNKLLAASPFREDRSPSFFVDLETGGWLDAGAFDLDYERGNLPKLLAFLRNETYEESCERLIELYGTRYNNESERFRVPLPTITKEKARKILAESELRRYTYRANYLEKRNIPERVQQFAHIGYSKEDKAITIPWRHADGRLANIKFRKTYGKAFWYKRGAAPIRTLVYGIDKVYKHNLTEIVVCEAEIDALSWYASGVPAIALGGTAVTKNQLDIIRKSPIQTLIIAPDNDAPGEKLNTNIANSLRDSVELKRVRIPKPFKDANEALINGVNLRELNHNPIRFSLLK